LPAKRFVPTGRRASDALDSLPLRTSFDSLGDSTGLATAGLLTNNAQAWATRWWMLEHASTSIDTTYFILEKDIFGFAFLGHLLKKARAGKNVRLMIDAAGSASPWRSFKYSGLGQDYLQELVNTGHASVHVYQPFSRRIPEQLRHPLSSTALIACNHDKILSVDGRYGLTGGRNISKSYFADPADMPEVFRDTDVYVDSAHSAAALRRAFEVEFDDPRLNDAIGPDRLGNWVPRDLELIGAYVLMDLWLKAPRLTTEQAVRLRVGNRAFHNRYVQELYDQTLRRLPNEGIGRPPTWHERARLRALARELTSYGALRGAGRNFSPETGAVLDASVKVLDRTSSVANGPDSLTGALLRLTRGAQHSIIIQNPYVVLTASTLAALEEAGRRGVQITILTNSPESTDSALTQAFFLRQWPRILARVSNLRLFVMSGKRKLHAKTAVFDRTVTWIGTYNLDYISNYVNGEVATATWSPSMAKATINAFHQDELDPANGVLEFKIARNADGTPRLKNGEPIVAYGPDDHLSFFARLGYRLLGYLAHALEYLPQAAPLRDAGLGIDRSAVSGHMT